MRGQKPKNTKKYYQSDPPASGFLGVKKDIFVLNFFHDSTNSANRQRQAGVTLLLAILVLSSILAIAFSLATILFIEVRSSGDLLRTEPALYGATGLGEQAIFSIKRKVCGAGPSTCFTYVSQFGNNVNLPNQPVQNSTSTPSFQDKVAPGTTFNNANIYPIYDAVAGNSTTSSNYGKITLTYLNTGNTDPLIVYLCQFKSNEPVDPTGLTPNTYHSTACTDPTDTLGQHNDSYWLTKNFSLYPNTPVELTSATLDPRQQQELIIYNPNTGGSNIFVQITTYDSDGVTAKGLPYIGQTSVDVTTANSGVGRKIRVLVPNGSGTSGNSASNLAIGKSATQSSTAFGGTADRAVDGNTDGNWNNNSVTHTNSEANAWWQVDLGASANVSSITVWNRTDCCGNRLSDYSVFLSNTSFGAPTWSSHQTSMPDPSTNIPVGAGGRYVRVQLTGTDYLSLAEVQVFGSAGGGSATPFISSITSTGAVRNDYGGWVGMGITVGASPIQVTALGRIMLAGNNGTHTVKIVQASNGVDISGGSASVNMSGGTAGSFVYQNLGSPVTLSANTSYYILSQEASGGDQWYDWNTVVQTTAVASDNLGVYGFAAPYSTFSASNQGYVPVNFKY